VNHFGKTSILSLYNVTCDIYSFRDYKVRIHSPSSSSNHVYISYVDTCITSKSTNTMVAMDTLTYCEIKWSVKLYIVL